MLRDPRRVEAGLGMPLCWKEWDLQRAKPDARVVPVMQIAIGERLAF